MDRILFLFKQVLDIPYVIKAVRTRYKYGHLSSHLSPLTLEVVGAPQMTLQQYLSILPCLPLPSGNLQTPKYGHLHVNLIESAAC